MQTFENIKDLVSHMFEKLHGDEPVSVVADKELSVAIMKELLTYDNIIIDICNIDSFEYDREYLVSLYDEVDTYYWHISIEPIYNYENEKYFATDGYVLFHEDVNSKALVDMLDNEFIELSKYDWFVIGEDIEDENSEENELNDNYTVNGKPVSKESFDKYVSQFKNPNDNNSEYHITIKGDLDMGNAEKIIKDMEHRMLHMNDMFREMDCFRRLFNW